MLTIQDLTLTAHNHDILAHINLSFQDNHVYGIIGPNGVGKTTLFKSILGITRYHGKILFNGAQPNDLQIGKLIEYPNFYQNLTVEQNLQLFARYMNADLGLVSQALEKVNLLKEKTTRFSDLSLGTKQRLGIARALLGNNHILLFDEPQNGLDPLGIKSIRELLNDPKLREDKVILLASHNLNEITKIVDNLIFVDNGQILCQIRNQTTPYYLFRTQQTPALLPNFDANPNISMVQNSSFILTTYVPNQLRTHYPQLAVRYIGKITSLESLFDFVITKGVVNNVDFN